MLLEKIMHGGYGFLKNSKTGYLKTLTTLVASSSVHSVLEITNLHNKRFRFVSEHRNTEEREFQCWPREEWNKSPSPLFYSRHFSRGLWLLFLVLCDETARKRLLRDRRLGNNCR